MAGGGSAPGQRRGGRAKGTVNRRTAGLVEQLEALGLNPIAELAAASATARDQGDLANWISANKSLLPYLYPRRKAIDVTTSGGPLSLQVVTGVPETPAPPPPAALSEGEALLAELRRTIDRLP